MAAWDVSASGVSQVLANTGDAAQTIGTALGGSSDGVSKGVGDVASNIGVQAQSSLIGTALQGFFEARQVAMTSIMDRIGGVMQGTADAVNAFVAHDEAMADAISVAMSQACTSSDFTQFLPPQN
jgi:hypothetical protein